MTVGKLKGLLSGYDDGLQVYVQYRALYLQIKNVREPPPAPRASTQHHRGLTLEQANEIREEYINAVRDGSKPPAHIALAQKHPASPGAISKILANRSYAEGSVVLELLIQPQQRSTPAKKTRRRNAKRPKKT